MQADADKMKAIISKNGYKKLSVEKAAEDAGLIDWYDMVCSHLSDAIHPSASSLEEDIIRDSEENIKVLKNEPEIHEYDYLYMTAIDTMRQANIAISQIFGLDISTFDKEVSVKLREFSDSL